MMYQHTIAKRHNGRHTVKLIEYGGTVHGNVVSGFTVEHGRVSSAMFPYTCPTYPDRDAAYNAACRDFREGGA